MERFKGIKGEWKLYGRTTALLSGLTYPDSYVVTCNDRIVAEGIRNINDAKVIRAGLEMLEMLIFLIEDEQLSSEAMEDDVRRILQKIIKL